MKNDEATEPRALAPYEAPQMFEVGSFQEDTGYIGLEGSEPITHSFSKFW
ncbi:lasso RiPP family leader peptide-containing protein [Streptomyces mobaraensis NBRC 13819 = DSM 40847]|uniref:Lasso RiPP family leader peptide-containing protein n=1 Tax=Streptomyces mobaraensis TaxID=35621 RepID=A0A5N5W6T3_STRMB|nr:lasso RiPP family leader peptide-containing protein [Streptomyces mobaraensis]KAB7843609.1 lasso RiPP family leader peptide-containing protein [Streptomyces mobaraensis]QTT76235.1 lasso RiPP family leader peptide-containing protein [Streptomyces mobaraensis NBRC 13819 = DSM 40847]